jgi:hypothetical protein
LKSWKWTLKYSQGFSRIHSRKIKDDLPWLMMEDWVEDLAETARWSMIGASQFWGGEKSSAYLKVRNFNEWGGHMMCITMMVYED